MNFVDRVIGECVDARGHGAVEHGVSVTYTNEQGVVTHRATGTIDDSGVFEILLPPGFPSLLPELNTEEVESMSLGLSLLPVERLELSAFCQTLLKVAPDPYLLDELQEIPAQPVPHRFNTYLCEHESSGDPHYGNTQTTGSGEKLLMAPVRELLRFSDHPGVYEEPQNRAVWAYLRELPEESMIALYWD